MIDRKIDSFITTNNGINTHTYTGNELGKKAFVAKTSNVVSEPYPVIDAIFKDGGTSSDKNDNWDNASLTKTRTSEYTECSATSSDGKFQTKSITYGQTCELDYYCTSTTGNGLSVRQGANAWVQINLDAMGLQANTWHHLKIVLDENATYKCVVSNTTNSQTIKSTRADLNLVNMRVDNTYSTRYKNFVIYPSS